MKLIGILIYNTIMWLEYVGTFHLSPLYRCNYNTFLRNSFIYCMGNISQMLANRGIQLAVRPITYKRLEYSIIMDNNFSVTNIVYELSKTRFLVLRQKKNQSNPSTFFQRGIIYERNQPSMQSLHSSLKSWVKKGILCYIILRVIRLYFNVTTFFFHLFASFPEIYFYLWNTKKD